MNFTRSKIIWNFVHKLTFLQSVLLQIFWPVNGRVVWPYSYLMPEIIELYVREHLEQHF
jgi:hypothetical protein